MSTAEGLQFQDSGCPQGLAPAEFYQDNGQTIDPAAFVKRKNGEYSLDILVRGAKCGACLAKIENGIYELTGVDLVRMNLTTGRLRVTWSDPTFPAVAILHKLNTLGYGASPFDPDEAKTEHAKRERSLLIAMAVAGFAAANVMLLSVSIWAGGGEMGHETKDLMHWVSAAIALPAALFAGRPFFRSALDAIKAGHVNMDVPISLAVFLALGMSLYVTITGSGEAYFDAAVMLLFFLLIGRFLDARLQREAHSAARDLAAMQSVSVTRLDEHGVAHSVKASELAPGDIIQVAPGERFAVDVELVEGISELDTRMVTGETRPVPVEPGEHIYSGAVNIIQSVKARVLATTEDSMLSEIGKLLETGEQKRSSYRQIADFAARLYVPIVHTLAAGSFLVWFFLVRDVQHALFISISVLIITCPCALALAAPVVQVVAVGRLFRKAVYLKSGDSLERIAACDHIVFDKTGTLTQPEPNWTRTPESESALSDAAMLARGSRHPFSRAIVRAAGAGPLANNITEIAGCGVEGELNGATARLGSAKWILGEKSNATNMEGMLLFQFGDKDPVVFEFTETPVSGFETLSAELLARGVTCEVLSGDSEERVADLAQMMQIETWSSGVSPTDKADRMLDLQDGDRKVLMVGDGLNDAGALAHAHASLTPGGAVDISRSASDGVYSGEDLLTIVDIIDVARASKRTMLENFGFAALYNMIAVPIAVLGFVTPLIAAIAMSGSSLVVTLNALRLNLAKERRPSS